MRILIVLAGIALTALPLAAQVPAAVVADPPRDSLHPPRMEVLHVPSGGVKINGVAYVAAGPGPHPVFILLHGLPGNEKNLDLAQAVRRAGWTSVTFNYRGSWGSPGKFRFANNLADADAVIAFLKDTANVRRLGLDTTRMVLAGHSMGGWVTVLTASHHPELAGAVLLSAADMGAMAGGRRDRLVRTMADNMESLAGVTPESMADEIRSRGAHWRFADAEPGLAHLPLLVLTANDGLAPMSDSLVVALRALGNERITTLHAATDHSWSDRRIELESAVINWLDALAREP
ncbi:MAG TPA: alpha/beta hydrolase [Gemmatimonadales bacterium]|nr:alpha/beta hydrolase [Gemmatimonadales bacterium]